MVALVETLVGMAGAAMAGCRHHPPGLRLRLHVDSCTEVDCLWFPSLHDVHACCLVMLVSNFSFLNPKYLTRLNVSFGSREYQDKPINS